MTRRNALAITPLGLTSLHVGSADEGTNRRSYKASDAVFPNPERGFHGRANPPGGGTPGQQDRNHPPLTADDLRALRDEPERMGYLLRLTKVEAPDRIDGERRATIHLTLANDGFGRVLNPRAILLLLRMEGQIVHRQLFDFGYGNRRVLPGPGEERTLALEIQAPPGVIGNAEVLFQLPDPTPALFARPEFAIRLANRDLWESATGYHRLGIHLALG